MVRRLALCLTLLQGLSGCILTTTEGLAMLSIGTIIATDKTPTDHVATVATGKDCSSVKYSKTKKYCTPVDKSATQADTALYGQNGKYEGTGPFCYRTLGDVTCYTQPDPQSAQARVQ
jgi:hypothetical protein